MVVVNAVCNTQKQKEPRAKHQALIKVVRDLRNGFSLIMKHRDYKSKCTQRPGK